MIKGNNIDLELGLVLGLSAIVIGSATYHIPKLGNAAKDVLECIYYQSSGVDLRKIAFDINTYIGTSVGAFGTLFSSYYSYIHLKDYFSPPEKINKPS